jgi:uncharacterized protein YjbJ (UPF0337 family)
MDKEEIKGGAEKLGGKIKEQWGKVTGNPATEEKGKEEQAEGQVRETVGKTRDAIKDAVKH